MSTRAGTFEIESCNEKAYKNTKTQYEDTRLTRTHLT